MATTSMITDMGAIDVSMPASGDLSTFQYHAVKVDGSNEIASSGANEKSLGILQNKPTAQGDVARVRIQGISKAKVSEGVTFGQFLTPNASAELEVVDAANEEYCARALGAYATDDFAEVQLTFGEAVGTDA